MATLQAATTSTGAIVSNSQAVSQLCGNHCLRTLTWEVDEEGELVIWDYNNFKVYVAHNDGLPDYDGGIVTHEFLRQLAEYIDDDEELSIQTHGYTKCRFPVLATWYVIRDGEVLHADLSGLDPIDE